MVEGLWMEDHWTWSFSINIDPSARLSKQSVVHLVHSTSGHTSEDIARKCPVMARDDRKRIYSCVRGGVQRLVAFRSLLRGDALLVRVHNYHVTNSINIPSASSFLQSRTQDVPSIMLAIGVKEVTHSVFTHAVGYRMRSISLS